MEVVELILSLDSKQLKVVCPVWASLYPRLKKQETLVRQVVSIAPSVILVDGASRSWDGSCAGKTAPSLSPLWPIWAPCARAASIAPVPLWIKFKNISKTLKI